MSLDPPPATTPSKSSTLTPVLFPMKSSKQNVQRPRKLRWQVGSYMDIVLSYPLAIRRNYTLFRVPVAV